MTEKPKNYTKRLETALRLANERIQEAEDRIAQMRAHLNLPKFRGVEADGSRKDWVSTGDVLNRLEGVSEPLNQGAGWERVLEVKLADKHAKALREGIPTELDGEPAAIFRI